MNYVRIYQQLMDRAKTRQLNGYAEKHHVIPRCIGGGEDAGNLVDLTAKEHYIAHRLLVEIHPTNTKLRYAYWMMCSMKADHQRRYKVSARAYEYAKSLVATRSEETRQKISDSLRQSYASGVRTTRAGTKMPPSFGESISRAKKGMVGTNKGIPMSDAQKLKISQTLKGHTHSQSARDKISQTLRSKPMQICPYCNKSSIGTAFRFYHFENCKFKK